jgi:hypothetical protein
MTIRGMLMAIKKLNLTNRFLIIGTEGWADRQDVVSDLEMQAVGSISIRIHSKYVETFDDYYFALDPFNNTRNVWFREFWEDKFHCKMPATRINNSHTTTTPSYLDEYSSTVLDNETDYSSLLPAVTSPSTFNQTPFCTGLFTFILVENFKLEFMMKFH